MKRLSCLAIPLLLCCGCEDHRLKREAQEWIEASNLFSHHKVTRFDNLRVVPERKRVCGTAYYRGDGVMADIREEEWLFIYQRGQMLHMMRASEPARPGALRYRHRWRNCLDE